MNEVKLDLAIGVDVGFTAARRSTGIVVLDRRTRTLAAGSAAVVMTSADANAYLTSELDRLKPGRAHACIDGSFAPALSPRSSRLVERFFSSGPFASNPGGGALKLRLCPAPTPVGSQFLAATRAIIGTLARAGLRPMTVGASSLAGTMVEIFPTMFMASLLPPHAYTGKRTAHTDDLWLRLVGDDGEEMHRVLRPYGHLVAAVEAAPRGDRHDLRAAALAAIAADVFAARAPAGKDAMMFFGHHRELGFVLPPRSMCDPAFLAMLTAHWNARAPALPGLVWL